MVTNTGVWHKQRGACHKYRGGGDIKRVWYQQRFAREQATLKLPMLLFYNLRAVACVRSGFEMIIKSICSLLVSEMGRVIKCDRECSVIYS